MAGELRIGGMSADSVPCDRFKYGQTTSPESPYSRAELGRAGLVKVVEFRGSQKMALIQEKLKIYGYFLVKGIAAAGK